MAIHTGLENGDERVFWIKPRVHLKPGRALLTAPDQIAINIIIRRLECFLIDDDFDEVSFMNAVSGAHAALLEEMPLLAGQITLDENGKRIAKIPENPTSQLKFVKNLDFDAQDFDKKHWPPHMLTKGFCLYPLPQPGLDSYNFGLQCTFMKGGLVLCFETSHACSDGIGQAAIALAFAHHLSRFSRSKPHKFSGYTQPDAPLQWIEQRQLPKAIHPARDILKWKDWIPKPVRHHDSLPREELIAFYRARMELLSFSAWNISENNLKKLRDLTIGRQSTERPHSLATSISCWFWAAVTRARNLPPGTESCLITPIQCRGRVPELPYTWQGNCLVYGRANATVEEINTLSIHELGSRQKKSIKWWTPERIKEYWGSIDDVPDVEQIEFYKNTDLGPNFELSNLQDTPSPLGVSWAPGMIPRYTRLPGLGFIDGYGVVWPKHPDGSIEVTLNLSRDTLARLSADVEFRTYVEPRASSDPAIDELIAVNTPKIIRARI